MCTESASQHSSGGTKLGKREREGGGFQPSELRHFGQHHYGSSEEKERALLVDGTKRKGSRSARGNVKANATSLLNEFSKGSCFTTRPRDPLHTGLACLQG